MRLNRTFFIYLFLILLIVLISYIIFTLNIKPDQNKSKHQTHTPRIEDTQIIQNDSQSVNEGQND